MYGSSSYALVDAPYPADLQAAAKAGTLNPNDDTGQNPFYALAAGGAISTANDLAPGYVPSLGAKFSMPTISANGSRVLNRKIQAKLGGQEYGYGIALIKFGPNKVYFHGGESPGFNSFMGYDPVNDVALVIWTNLTVSLDGLPTANTIMRKMLDQIYTSSPQ
jgi:D-alanyl-D-alanine carboxypeptidase